MGPSSGPGAQRGQYLETTYSATENSFATNLSTVANLECNKQSGDNDNPSNSRRSSRGSGAAKNVLDSFVGASKTNWLLTYLLGATCLTTIVNTILLSFIVKSVQLNEAGFLDGQVAWDERLASTILKLPARLASGKSIITKAIRSASASDTVAGDFEQALQLRRLMPGELVAGRNNRQLNHHRSRQGGHAKPSAAAEKEDTLVFLSSPRRLSGSTPADDATESRRAESELARLQSPSAAGKSNYMAVNLAAAAAAAAAADCPTSAGLVIGAKRLVLDLLPTGEGDAATANNKRAKQQQQRVVSGRHSNPDNQPSNQLDDDDDEIEPHSIGDDHDREGADNKRPMPKAHGRTSRLLEIDGEQQSISLPLERQLRLVGSPSLPAAQNGTTGSGRQAGLLIAGKLTCSQISGSLGSDLDVQTRDGNLVCSSGAQMRLISRSAEVRLSSFDELIMSAPELHLNPAGSLFIPSGIEYLDHQQADAGGRPDLAANQVSAQQSAGKGTIVWPGGGQYNSKPRPANPRTMTPAQSTAAGQPRHEQEEEEGNLRAYNLMLVNGLLVAVA